MSRERIERVGRDATAARPDYAPIAAFAVAFSGCLTTLNLAAFADAVVLSGLPSGWSLTTVVGRRLVDGIFLQTNSPRRLSALFRASLVARTSPWTYGAPD